jgi:hypothetical protein
VTPDDVARRFEAETGVALQPNELLGTTILMPADDSLGSFGIVVGDARDVVFPVHSYADDVHLIVWSAKQKKLDAALKKIVR